MPRETFFVSGAALRASCVVLALAAAGPALAQRAVIVVDANSGRVLHEEAADAVRYPASLTKVMTLYLLFEQIEAGRLTLNSRLSVSANAARQPPTRLGVRPGDTIRVEDAILALITRSANDVSVVVAENLAGSVEAFAQRMTQRARQLGMSRTTFTNPHGLPDPAQRTTARDLALLGRAVYERFPQYSRFFARRSFAYGRRMVVGHNRLLGRVAAVDGIKTGYTRASGYNLLTSARGGGRHFIGVVLGGRSGASRDAEMARLVSRHMPRMATARTDFSVARRVRGRAEPVIARREDHDIERLPIQLATPPARPADAPVQLATPPARPVEAPVQLASAPPRPPERPRLQIVPVPPPAQVAAAAPPEPPAAAPAPQSVAAPAPLPEAPPRELRPVAQPTRVASIAGPVMQWQVGPQPVQREETITTASTAQRAANAAAEATPPAAREAMTGWAVQIAATNSESEAQRMLREAQGALGRPFSRARPVTEPVQRGAATLYRARLAGFGDRSAAEAACRVLRRSDYECMPIRL